MIQTPSCYGAGTGFTETAGSSNRGLLRSIQSIANKTSPILGRYTANLRDVWLGLKVKGIRCFEKLQSYPDPSSLDQQRSKASKILTITSSLCGFLTFGCGAAIFIAFCSGSVIPPLQLATLVFAIAAFAMKQAQKALNELIFVHHYQEHIANNPNVSIADIVQMTDFMKAAGRKFSVFQGQIVSRTDLLLIAFERLKAIQHTDLAKKQVFQQEWQAVEQRLRGILVSKVKKRNLLGFLRLKPALPEALRLDPFIVKQPFSRDKNNRIPLVGNQEASGVIDFLKSGYFSTRSQGLKLSSILRKLEDRKACQISDWSALLQIKDGRLPLGLEDKSLENETALRYIEAPSSWVALCLLRRIDEKDLNAHHNDCFHKISDTGLAALREIQLHLQKHYRLYGIDSPNSVRDMELKNLENLLASRVRQTYFDDA